MTKSIHKIKENPPRPRPEGSHVAESVNYNDTAVLCSWRHLVDLCHAMGETFFYLTFNACAP